MKSIKSEENSNQFYVLLKHFVLRMFNNDIIKYENQGRERLIVVMTILAIVGGYVTHKLLFRFLIPALSGVSSDVVFIPHIVIAVTAIIITSAIYLVSFPLSFKRFLSSGSESDRQKSPLLQKVIRITRRSFDSVFLRHPIQRGMFYFVCQALKRSRKHQLQLVTYMALPTAYIIADLVYFHSRSGWSYFRVPNFFLVGVSLIFYFFLAAGLRMIVRHPIILSANWIFQLTEIKEKKHYMKGLKKAMLFLLGLPLFIGLFIFYLYCWGFRLAFFHSFYSVVIFLLLVEVFFNTYKKIPFAGEFEPGKPNIKVYWPLILGGFLEWYVLLSNIGLILLNSPKYYILFFLVIFAFYWGFVFRRYRQYKNEDFGFIYDEEPQELMLSLNLGT